MKAMILAAGRGERMRPLTDTTPKPLLRAGGKPLVVWLIERLVRAGVRELTVNVSHLGQLIEAELGNGRAFGARIDYSYETEPLETAGGIAWALPLLGTGPFMVVNSDVHSDYDFRELARWAPQLTARGRLAHMVMVDNPAHHPAGDFCLNGDVLSREGTPRLTFSGYGLYHRALFESIVAGEKKRLTSVLEQPMAEGRVTGEHYRGWWSDIGTPQRLAELDVQLRAGAAL